MNPRRVPRIPPVRLVLLVLLASTVAAGGTAAVRPADTAAPQAPAPSTAGVVVVLVSANAEWAVVKSLNPDAAYSRSPWGEYFQTTMQLPTIGGLRGRQCYDSWESRCR